MKLPYPVALMLFPFAYLLLLAVTSPLRVCHWFGRATTWLFLERRGL